jgi:hypothetical protein
VNTVICNAIKSWAVIEFYYERDFRRVEPHCHGVSKAGHEVLRGYQTGGFSQSGNPIGWRLFDVRKISNLYQTNETFSTARPGYNPNDQGMISVHCHV